MQYSGPFDVFTLIITGFFAIRYIAIVALAAAALLIFRRHDWKLILAGFLAVSLLIFVVVWAGIDSCNRSQYGCWLDSWPLMGEN